MSQGKLTYFGVHGRAGVIRMMLTHGKVDFEDVIVNKEEWATLKADMPGGQIPCW